MGKRLVGGLLLGSWLAFGVPAASAAVGWPVESKRLASAKDFIADEQWMRAIEVLQVLLRDTKETGKDEALFWLAHSQKHAGDAGEALATIRRLERDYPSSVWVKPAGALRPHLEQHGAERRDRRRERQDRDRQRPTQVPPGEQRDH